MRWVNFRNDIILFCVFTIILFGVEQILDRFFIGGFFTIALALTVLVLKHAPNVIIIEV